MDRNVEECLNAAMKITEIVNELTEGRQIFRAFWVCASKLRIGETNTYGFQSLPSILLSVLLLFYMSIR
jgi:hypothetical protein